jgi:hypothetical protein
MGSFDYASALVAASSVPGTVTHPVGSAADLRRALVQTRPSPELAGDLDRVDAGLFPPSALVADAMNVTVTSPESPSGAFRPDCRAF